MKHNEQLNINNWDVISQCWQGNRTLATSNQLSVYASNQGPTRLVLAIPARLVQVLELVSLSLQCACASSRDKPRLIVYLYPGLLK